MDSLELSATSWCILMVCGLLVGISKTGVPGLGILVVALMAGVLPPRLSTGVLLPLLILADVFAVRYYHRQARWSRLLPLLPAALAGIVVGAFVLHKTNDAAFGPVIGSIVLLMLFMQRLRRRIDGHGATTSRGVAPWLGFVAGVTTMMANAGGPIVIIYLLAMRLPKMAFVGTGAWFFLIVNIIKVPFSVHIGLINLETLRIDLCMAPAIVAGALTGIWGLKRIPQRAFNLVVEALAVLAALSLVMR